MHTKNGTAAGADGKPIWNIKLPHIGGHEGVGRIVLVGQGCKDDVQLGKLVGIRFASRICRRCEFCMAGKEQHCLSASATNHLHHEDGSFQQYVALDADYLTILPGDVPTDLIGPVFCAGLTALKVESIIQVDWKNQLITCGCSPGDSKGCHELPSQARSMARRDRSGWRFRPFGG